MTAPRPAKSAREIKSSYTVTVTASDGTLTATVDVTVTVTNIDEAGTVALSTNQPSARAEITAALTDPEGCYRRCLAVGEGQ